MSRDRSLSADLTVGWRIVRADTVRQWRRLRGNRRLLALAVLVALLVLPVALGASRWLYDVGQQSRDGLGVPVVAVARNLLVPSLALYTVFSGLTAAQQLGEQRNRTLL